MSISDEVIKEIEEAKKYAVIYFVDAVMFSLGYSKSENIKAYNDPKFIERSNIIYAHIKTGIIPSIRIKARDEFLEKYGADLKSSPAISIRDLVRFLDYLKESYPKEMKIKNTKNKVKRIRD